MPLPEKRDHRIALAEAVELTREHRAQRSAEPKAHFFFRDAFDTLLAQKGVAGIRIYRGRGKDGAPNLVMVAVDQEGNDLTGEVMEQCYPCPPICPPDSPLQK
jgi:hypothetical protein